MLINIKVIYTLSHTYILASYPPFSTCLYLSLPHNLFSLFHCLWFASSVIPSHSHPTVFHSSTLWPIFAPLPSQWPSSQPGTGAVRLTSPLLRHGCACSCTSRCTAHSRVSLLSRWRGPNPAASVPYTGCCQHGMEWTHRGIWGQECSEVFGGSSAQRYWWLLWA